MPSSSQAGGGICQAMSPMASVYCYHREAIGLRAVPYTCQCSARVTDVGHMGRRVSSRTRSAPGDGPTQRKEDPCGSRLSTMLSPEICSCSLNTGDQEQEPTR